MSYTRSKKGFTLVEILIALVLIATILSMVYGSYFATSKSARVCQARIMMCHQGRTTLDQMARQIRCAYAGIIKDADIDSGTHQKRIVREDGMNYFTGGRNASNGEILHFVTTNGFVGTQGKPVKGLFEMTYRFDKRLGTLFLSRRRFIGTIKKTPKREWMPIAKNIEYLDLEFFNGRQWLSRWDYEDKEKLPSAVRMEIGCRDEDNRRYDYRTVTYVSCHENDAGTNTETLVSIDRQ